MNQPAYMGAPRVGNDSKAQRSRKQIITIVCVVLILIGLYIAYLVLAPARPVRDLLDTQIDLNTDDDAADARNRIQIEKLGLEVPFNAGGSEQLDLGAWHRYPERGDPKQGGNFILSAHRFTIGLTPAETKQRSPFYTLDRLTGGDRVRVFFDGEWFDYQVTRTYSVKPDDIAIEVPTNQERLTLYSCSLNGSADGRIVVEAHRI